MTRFSAREAEEMVRAAIIQVAPDVIDVLPSMDPADDLWDVLELDSMDHQNVMVAIFERSGVEIAERDYPNLRSLDNLAAHIASSSP